MTVRELREKYLAFFESKGHTRYPSGSLVPIDVTGKLDESLLFNGAGMIQFKPYFRGTATPENRRLTTVQKCVRTGDIEEVGDATHLTFFEMLGNFSFGDYFKADAIRFSWEFLTSAEWLGLDPARLSFTVFEIDDEAESTWRACGAQRVFRLGEETNYWPAGAFSNGPPGPCGPNSEMFYWVGSGPAPTGDYSVDQWLADEGAGKWVEIWNDVFIQFDWQGDPKPDGKGYVKTAMPDLPFKSIDTGMGLERTAFVLGGFTSVYDTEGFQALFVAIRGLATKDSERAERIIADHLRTATFC
ncbi:alanine--tRNA ligase, partial [bacterium]